MGGVMDIKWTAKRMLAAPYELEYRERISRLWGWRLDALIIAIIIGGLTVSAGIGYALALAGAPQQRWLFCGWLGWC